MHLLLKKRLPSILATYEADIRRIVIPSNPVQTNSSRSDLKNTQYCTLTPKIKNFAILGLELGASC
jgi:hypothetical protein